MPQEGCDLALVEVQTQVLDCQFVAGLVHLCKVLNADPALQVAGLGLKLGGIFWNMRITIMLLTTRCCVQ